MDVNAKGTFLGCKAVLPYMKSKQRGRIINVASRWPLPDCRAHQRNRHRTSTIINLLCKP
jgi:NAD(P)-dependent dehydrogenase (short-subunit alcohol dehydrogenase family)